MLSNDGNHFLWRYETGMYGGNGQWASPEEAVKVGEVVGEELIGRYDAGHIAEDSPQVHRRAHQVLDAALEVVNYAALPTERRANILHGVINALASNGELGGEPEWVKATEATAAQE
jgi:hypothetical protein